MKSITYFNEEFEVSQRGQDTPVGTLGRWGQGNWAPVLPFDVTTYSVPEEIDPARPNYMASSAGKLGDVNYTKRLRKQLFNE